MSSKAKEAKCIGRYKVMIRGHSKVGSRSGLRLCSGVSYSDGGLVFLELGERVGDRLGVEGVIFKILIGESLQKVSDRFILESSKGRRGKTMKSRHKKGGPLHFQEDA